MNCFGFPAVLADSVKNCPARVHLESVALHQMLFQFNHILTVKMDQFSTFLTFAVETGCLVTVFLCSEIFKTGTARPVHIVFGDQPLLHHLLQIAVNCRCSDRNSLFFKMQTDICDRHMCSLHGPEI